MDKKEAMQRLTDAQIMMDRLEQTANIHACTMAPLNLPSYQLSDWQEEERTRNLGGNPEWLEARERRDQCLAVLGLTLEAWQEKWAAVLQQARQSPTSTQTP